MTPITAMGFTHTFAGNPLDRADGMRRSEAAIQAAENHPDTRYLALWNLNVLVEPFAADTSAAVGPPLAGHPGIELSWLSRAQIARLEISVRPVLLGLREDVAHFAIDVSQLEDPTFALELDAGYRFEDCRVAAMALPGAQSGIVAQSRSQLDWHRRHQFCSVCGNRTSPEKGGHVRRCADCKAEHFPRTDPVAIMLIEDGDCCLLGQSAGRLARTGMYSALAGFIDQGESIEEAVRREVAEEAGIKVGAVRYHSSQPWPFPSSLMIGCHGKATSTQIHIDSAEMADVRWFRREEVRAALATRRVDLKVPGPIAIAHHLIKAWVNAEVDSH